MYLEMLVKRFLPHPLGVLDVSPLHTHWGPAPGDQWLSTLLGPPDWKVFHSLWDPQKTRL